MSVVATRLVFLAFLGLVGFITYNALYLQEQRNASMLPARKAPAAPITAPVRKPAPAATAELPPLQGKGAAPQLVTAIQRELKTKGVALTDRPTPAAYRVEGAVTLGSSREGKQPIQIEWVVRDPNGKKLGTVSQKNDIPEGSLDGSWGRVADQAASAAVQGILKLLPSPSTAVN